MHSKLRADISTRPGLLEQDVSNAFLWQKQDGHPILNVETETNGMGRARFLYEKQGYFSKGMATIAVFFLIALAGHAQVTPQGSSGEISSAQELNKYPGLLPEFGRLLERFQRDIQFPPGRGESRLLALLPESTTYYAAIPNYGDVAHQALAIFRQELQGSAPLRDWWTHGELAANGPKLEGFAERFYQLHQYLGEEVVISGAKEGQDSKLLVVAEVRKPGLKSIIQQMVEEFGTKSKPGVRVLDLKELATAKERGAGQELVILVRPDFVVAALDLATLHSFNARLDRSKREIVSSPFGQRVAQAYQGGVTILAAADLRKILEQLPAGTTGDQNFQRSGFADMKYLVWEHKDVAGRTVSEAELSFVAPRHGAASWLAKPAHLGSLDFVSPHAMLAGTVALENPAQILEDAKDLTATSSSNPFAAVAMAEQALKLSLKDDLLSLLGGEITLELDNFTPPQPEWRAMLSVKDASHLRQTLNTLLAAARLESERADKGGVTYYRVRIPSGKATIEIGYAFVDGYLVAGSSEEAVAEAVRLHRSGGSLAKSQKLLASLPPGRSLDASALLYQDPIAMSSLQLRRAAPEMAEAFSQFAKATMPTVVGLYADETAIREASSSGTFDVATTLIVAAIAIPNLLRAKMAANEASAAGSMRSVNTAQVAYATTYPQRGYAPSLATFGTDPRGPNHPSADHAGFLDETLASESCTGDAWCTKSGFRLRVSAVCKKRVCEEYVVVATPENSSTGTRSFCSTSDGVIRFKPGAPLTVPLSPAECKAWPPLQ